MESHGLAPEGIPSGAGMARCMSGEGNHMGSLGNSWNSIKSRGIKWSHMDWHQKVWRRESMGPSAATKRPGPIHVTVVTKSSFETVEKHEILAQPTNFAKDEFPLYRFNRLAHIYIYIYIHTYTHKENYQIYSRSRCI